MATGVASQLQEFEGKSEQMKLSIDQSQTVLAQSITQLNTIMKSHLKVVHDRLGLHDVNFQQVAVKHSQYDAFATKQQQRQGRSGASASDGRIAPEVRGLIHEKDIKMRSFPETHDNAEVFRRWWKDVAE